VKNRRDDCDREQEDQAVLLGPTARPGERYKEINGVVHDEGPENLLPCLLWKEEPESDPHMWYSRYYSHRTKPQIFHVGGGLRGEPASQPFAKDD
jgi:hypothetical protein